MFDNLIPVAQTQASVVGWAFPFFVGEIQDLQFEVDSKLTTTTTLGGFAISTAGQRFLGATAVATTNGLDLANFHPTLLAFTARFDAQSTQNQR